MLFHFYRFEANEGFLNNICYNLINLCISVNYRLKLTELPDNILVSIFKLFHLQFSLQVVNRTCKRLHSLIEENSILWRFFEFDI